jgi:hypothetical protein
MLTVRDVTWSLKNGKVVSSPFQDWLESLKENYENICLTKIWIMYLTDVYCCKKNKEETSLIQLHRRAKGFITSDIFRFVTNVEPGLTQNSTLKNLFWNQMNF